MWVNKLQRKERKTSRCQRLISSKNLHLSPEWMSGQDGNKPAMLRSWDSDRKGWRSCLQWRSSSISWSFTQVRDEGSGRSEQTLLFSTGHALSRPTDAVFFIYQSIRVPPPTYGHEPWVVTARMRSRIQVSEMSLLRRMCGLSEIWWYWSCRRRSEERCCIIKSQMRWGRRRAASRRCWISRRHQGGGNPALLV